jgi:hypothetical protein
MNELVHDILANDDDMTSWAYLKPRGDMSHASTPGDKEFYRIHDYVRNRLERTPGNDGDPTHVGLQGYDRNAEIPFKQWLNRTGIGEASDWYEVNTAVTTQLVFTFENSIGENISLQELIDFNDNQGTGDSDVAWRPVLQVFREWHQSNDDNWWQRTHVDNESFIEVAGPVIPSTGSCSVTLDISNFKNIQGWGDGFHVCIGVGCCNRDGTSWKGGNDLFILPFEDSLRSIPGYLIFPFYCRFKIVTHNARMLQVLGLQFHVNSPMPAWVDATGTAPYFTIHSNMDGDLIGLTMRISKDADVLTFVSQNAATQTGNLKIQARETINYQETIKYLTPSVGPSPGNQQSPWADALNGITIPAGNTTEWEQVYANLHIGNIGTNGYAEYELWANSGGLDGHGNPEWYNIGYFRIHKIQYT